MPEPEAISAELKTLREAQDAAISAAEIPYLSGAEAALEWVLGETPFPPSTGAGL